MNNSIFDIKDILNEYTEDVQEGLKEAAISTAKESTSKLKQTSPKRIGAYAKSWTVKKETSRGSILCTVHNKKHYRLTHLLENGHMKRNGGKVAPRVHIKPVETTAIKAFEKQVENVIKNGG